MEKAELRGGRYAHVRTLGEGAQGETFEAVDKREGRLVAIKRFRVGKARAWKDVELAEREARTLQSLDHPLLPRYIEHFEEDGALYLVMERVEGESLLSARRAGAPFTWDDAVALLRDVGGALAHLHAHTPPIVHRDIKPGNIVRRTDGRYVLVDFGSVRDRLKPEGGSTVAGTFGYMAPEQFQGRALPVSDLYGLGATVLAMVTGKEPETLPHRGLAIDVEASLPRGTPRELTRALAAMLAPNPDERATSTVDVLRGLEGFTRDERRSPARDDPRRTRVDARAKSIEAHRRNVRERHEEARQRNARRQRERREAARIRRAERGPVPFLPRVVASLGLLVAKLAVFFAVAVVAPSVLVTLSVFFGPALRRAAAACVRASHRATGAIDRKMEALWEHPVADPPRERVRLDGEEDVVRVRAVDPAAAPRIAVEPALSQVEAEEVARRDAEAWAVEESERQRGRGRRRDR